MTTRPARWEVVSASLGCAREVPRDAASCAADDGLSAVDACTGAGCPSRVPTRCWGAVARLGVEGARRALVDAGLGCTGWSAAAGEWVAISTACRTGTPPTVSCLAGCGGFNDALARLRSSVSQVGIVSTSRSETFMEACRVRADLTSSNTADRPPTRDRHCADRARVFARTL